MVRIEDLFDNKNEISIQDRKAFTEFYRTVQKDSKPKKCILCGTEKSSFCNSHSVPKMVLKNIAENGKVLQSNALVKLAIFDDEKGVKNSGVFHYICNECDSRYFQRYENPDNYNEIPTRYILAEIAMKNTLLQLSKRRFEHQLYKTISSTSNRLFNAGTIFDIQSLDERDYLEELTYHKSVAEGLNQEKYNLIYFTNLPYKVPIAAQTGIALREDLRGYQVNNIYEMSEKYTVETLHLCVFPLKNNTVIMLFCRKHDRKYNRFIKQFSTISAKEKLRYVNWLIYKYSENYYFSPKTDRELLEDNILKELSKEVDGRSNLGFVVSEDYLKRKKIKPDDIPNALDSKYAI